MFLVTDARFASVTQAFAERVGRDAEALVGRPLTDVVDPSDADEFAAALADVRTDDGPTSRVCRCRLTGDRAGRVVIELASVPGPTEAVGSVRADETLDLARDELATARERFGHLFDLIQDAVVEVEIVDAIPVVRSVNPAFTEVFGYGAETVVGESLNEFIVPADGGGQATDFDERTARGKVNYAVVTRQTASGPREFIYRGIPYDRGDGGRYGFAIYTDITDQRRRQRHLRVLHRVLRHNLRNELTIIAGVAASLRETVDDSDLRSQLDLIYDHSETLDTVSEKASTVAATLDNLDESTTFDLGSTAADVVERCRDRHPEAEITVSVDESVEVTACSALDDAVEELVANGVEHNDGDPTVRVAVESQDEEVHVIVADDGPGIPSSERAVVFDGADITQLRHATGLGLWLVRWVTEAAGGTVVYDRRDGWTSVTLCLTDVADATADVQRPRRST